MGDCKDCSMANGHNKHASHASSYLFYVCDFNYGSSHPFLDFKNITTAPKLILSYLFPSQNTDQIWKLANTCVAWLLTELACNESKSDWFCSRFFIIFLLSRKNLLPLVSVFAVGGGVSYSMICL